LLLPLRAWSTLGENSHCFLGSVLDAAQTCGRSLASSPVESRRLHREDFPQQIAGRIVAQQEAHLVQPLTHGHNGFDARLDRGGALGRLHAETSWMP
jgi:hypothetical protein